MSERATPIVISPQEYKNTQIAESKKQAAENRLDEGEEGGRYDVGGEIVDCNGNPVKGDAKSEAHQNFAGKAEQPAIRAERKP